LTWQQKYGESNIKVPINKETTSEVIADNEVVFYRLYAIVNALGIYNVSLNMIRNYNEFWEIY